MTCVNQGGVPLYDDTGAFLGALGVSGSSDSANDADVAEFAALTIAEFARQNVSLNEISAPIVYNDTEGVFLSSSQAYKMLLLASMATHVSASVAVFDSAKQLKAFLREDDAPLGTVYVQD